MTDVSTTPEQPEESPHDGEDALHELSDDDYFASLAEMPEVRDAEGNVITGLFDDVTDARESKARARAAGEGKA